MKLAAGAPVVFSCRPPTVPTTLITSVHDELGARVTPDIWNCRPPGAPDTVPSSVDVQVPLAPTGLARTRPAGRVSLNEVVVKLVAWFGLLSVNWMAMVPPCATQVEGKDSESVGG